MDLINIEQTADYLLEDITRSVALSDGTEQPITVFRLYWEYFDEMIANQVFTETKLVSLIEQTEFEMPYTLPESFMSVIGYAYRQIGEGKLGLQALR